MLSAFNGGNPLAIANAVKQVAADGFTVAGTAHFMGAEAKITATVQKNGDISVLAELAEVQLSHLLGAAPQLRLVPGFEVPIRRPGC